MHAKIKMVTDILLTVVGWILAASALILVPFILVMAGSIAALAYLRIFRNWVRKLVNSRVAAGSRYARS